MSITNKLVLEFPDEESRERFLGWLSDGGGEYQFLKSEEYEEGSIVKLDYKYAFPAWGYDEKVHGKAKRVIFEKGGG